MLLLGEICSELEATEAKNVNTRELKLFPAFDVYMIIIETKIKGYSEVTTVTTPPV